MILFFNYTIMWHYEMACLHQVQIK